MCICVYVNKHTARHTHTNTPRDPRTQTQTHTLTLPLSLSLSQLRPRTGRDIKTLMDLAPPSSEASAMHTSSTAHLPTGSSQQPAGASCLLDNHVVVCGLPACLDDFLAPFRQGMAGSLIRPRRALTRTHPNPHTLSLSHTHTHTRAGKEWRETKSGATPPRASQALPRKTPHANTSARKRARCKQRRRQ